MRCESLFAACSSTYLEEYSDEIWVEFCHSSAGIWEKFINQFRFILPSNFSFSHLSFHPVSTSKFFAAGHIRVNTKNIDVYLVFQLIQYLRAYENVPFF